MKKKNLVVLLILPFLISVIGVVTVNTTLKTIEKDITSIEWNYQDLEAFKLSEKHPLRAEAKKESGAFLAPGNELVWSVENKLAVGDENTVELAEIIKENGVYYLNPISEGEVYITCSNEKGSVSRRMEAIIYDKGAILLQTKVGGSQQNIDNTIYFGEYDLVNSQKTPAKVEFTVKCVPEELESGLVLESQTDNISFSLGEQSLSILSDGQGCITLSSTFLDISVSYSYNFMVVDEGVNVYTYDDLLN